MRLPRGQSALPLAAHLLNSVLLVLIRLAGTRINEFARRNFAVGSTKPCTNTAMRSSFAHPAEGRNAYDIDVFPLLALSQLTIFPQTLHRTEANSVRQQFARDLNEAHAAGSDVLSRSRKDHMADTNQILRFRQCLTRAFLRLRKTSAQVR